MSPVSEESRIWNSIKTEFSVLKIRITAMHVVSFPLGSIWIFKWQHLRLMGSSKARWACHLPHSKSKLPLSMSLPAKKKQTLWTCRLPSTSRLRMEDFSTWQASFWTQEAQKRSRVVCPLLKRNKDGLLCLWSLWHVYIFAHSKVERSCACVLRPALNITEISDNSSLL